ncbi:MAG TPA: HAD-IC family P-type ATPase [Actinomycetota bacterium]|nr:HAD-IC family P-type ATPase [Actinomycetota bacterium]
MEVDARSTTDAARGLTGTEVQDRRRRGEVNDVPSAPTRTIAQIVRANVFTRFNALLGAMLALIIVAGGPFQDALFGVVLVANALIGIVQEVRAKRTLDRLTLLTAPRAHVVRDGVVTEVAVGEVVLDDVLDVAEGAQIVVDGEVVATDGLEVDESLLTGEAEPIRKGPGDRVLSGSFVAAGSGRYRASAVGADAYAARIAQDARRFTLMRSELRSGIDRILKYVTWAIVPTAVLLFASQFRVHESWREGVSGAVAGTVAMIPEGLVLLTSIAFAVAVVRLARQRVLVQELPAVEGLARVDVLCIDKTGTLTEGKPGVVRVDRLGEDDPGPALAALAASDPAPNATMRAVEAAFPTAPPEWTRTDGVPFSSARKWSASAFGPHGAWVLGAPDVLLDPGELRERLTREAAAGDRVLLLARAEGLRGEDRPADLRPAAALMLADRVRPDAAATLAYFAEQDVAVKVLSGDHPATVGAIASSLGLPGADEPVDAAALGEEPSALATSLADHSVYGRVTPQQKRAMVGALQGAGHVVAMTGDGVNDALALKDADVGVAMGSGSDATRAVAQFVLLDSRFDALPSVVAEGRRVLGNIERTSGLYLTKTVYAMLLALATGVGGFVFPFLPRHLTLIGALTIGIPSFFLALAPNTQRFRPGFVARVLRFAIPTGTLAAIATFLTYSLATNASGVTLEQARTAAVMTLTWIGLLVLSIVAAPLSAWRLALVWAMGGLAVLAFWVPAAEDFFALELPPPTVWLAGIGIAALVWSFARLFVPEERPVGLTAGGGSG